MAGGASGGNAWLVSHKGEHMRVEQVFKAVECW